MEERLNLERATLDYFLDAYNQRKGTHLKFKGHSDKPDFIVEDLGSSKIVGIEVAHLFYNKDEAKMLLGRSSKLITELMNSSELIKKLNKILENKTAAARKYKFSDRMFLIVRVASRIFDRSTFDMFNKNMVVPPNIFDEIWLVFYDSSTLAWDDLKQL